MHERDAGENASTPDSDAINISAEVCIGSSTTVGATMVPLAFAGVESGGGVLCRRGGHFVGMKRSRTRDKGRQCNQ